MEKKSQLALTWPVENLLLARRRSCELTQKLSPCIEKVTTHLYELEDRLTLMRQNSSLSKEEKHTPAKNPQTKSNREWLVTKDPTSPRQQSIISASGAKLEIQGSGFSLLSSPRPYFVENQSLNLSDFGEMVIKETLLLLGRMETDRVNTIQSLVNQRERVLQLKEKIDDYAHRRMYFLPIAVQREHELCACNVQELKWHLAYKGRTRDRWTEKVRLADNVNKSIKEEVSYINKHSPWTESKVELERVEMLDIQQKQGSTDTELQGALGLLKAMEGRYYEKDQFAAKERERLNEQVDEVRQELISATDELSKYKMHHTSFVHSLNDARNRIKEMAEESEVLDNRLDRAEQLEQVQQEKVTRLKGKIKEQETEKVQLMEENTKLKTQKDEQMSLYLFITNNILTSLVKVIACKKYVY